MAVGSPRSTIEVRVLQLRLLLAALMLWRRIIGVALLACAASVASMLAVPPPAVVRPLQSARHRAPRLLIAETNSRVVALADVHGDYRALCAALTAAGLLDVETGGWCGGDATCS